MQIFRFSETHSHKQTIVYTQKGFFDMDATQKQKKVEALKKAHSMMSQIYNLCEENDLFLLATIGFTELVGDENDPDGMMVSSGASLMNARFMPESLNVVIPLLEASRYATRNELKQEENLPDFVLDYITDVYKIAVQHGAVDSSRLPKGYITKEAEMDIFSSALQDILSKFKSESDD